MEASPAQSQDDLLYTALMVQSPLPVRRTVTLECMALTQ